MRIKESHKEVLALRHERRGQAGPLLRRFGMLILQLVLMQFVLAGIIQSIRTSTPLSYPSVSPLIKGRINPLLTKEGYGEVKAHPVGFAEL